MKTLKHILIVLAIIITFLIITSTYVSAKTVIVNTDTLKLRKEASTDSTTLELLNNGEKLEYVDETGDWYKVKVHGITGYVHKDYTKVEETSATSQTTNSTTNTETTNTTNTTKTTNTTNTETNTTTENVTNVEENTETNTNPTTSIATSTTPVATELKVVKDSKLYILPLINSTLIQNVKKDSNVTVLSRTNGWVYVETSERTGWIRTENLVDSSVVSDDIDINDTTNNNTNNDANNNANNNSNNNNNNTTTNTYDDKEITAKIMYVNTNSIYVRKGPSTSTEIIDSLILNDTVKVKAENGDWYKVEVDGKEGYIAKRLLSNSSTNTTTRGDETREYGQEENTNTTTNTTTTSSSKKEQVVEYAKQYLGCKYVYGGSGPKTFDCSGFTMYVFKNFGVTLSHSAIAQSKVGTYVAKEDLQPGDLVFFTDYETGVGIGHCGIYVGDGDFIHASSGTGYCVKISTLLSGSYSKRYETARRIF